MALVLHELSTNAAKYGALSTPNGRLAVEWHLDPVGGCRIAWRESGGPRVMPPSRRGFGTILIDRSIPFDLGGESKIDYAIEGVSASFLIPSRFVETRMSAPVSPVSRSGAAAHIDASSHIEGRTALIVEDQLLIAIDLQQILESAGMRVLDTVTSTREALHFLSREAPDVAVLDVNLGNETSETIAIKLKQSGKPFLFATGYGDDGIIPASFSDVPVVRKPYERDDIVAQVARLLAGSAPP